MTEEEVQKLDPGLYFLFWTEEQGGGFSLAYVGSLPNGSRWFAPTNWVKLPGSHKEWECVRDVQRIARNSNGSLSLTGLDILSQALTKAP